MKDTIEVIKCDLCGKIIDTDCTPKDKYHYARVYYELNKDEAILKECDVCIPCQQMISSNYNSDHGKDVELYINKIMSELTHCKGSCNDNDTIITTIGHLKSIMLKVFYDKEDN